MLISKSLIRTLSILYISFMLAVMSACSGNGGGTDVADSGTGTGTGSVALLLTDAPSDIFEEINITVIKAELMSDDGRVTVFQGKRTINLLDLTDARIFAIREGIPSGSYNKIRLTLTEIELVDYNDTDSTADDLRYYPKLPGNGKLDLNPRGSFDVIAGSTLVVQIDMDANKSIHIVKKGNKDEYNFRPVVFIDIVTDTFKERYVKLHGTITALDDINLDFMLCNTDIPVQTGDDQMKPGSRGCVRVDADKTTSIFDINGMPVTFDSLVNGEEATVFGRLLRDSISHHDDDDDDHDHEHDNDHELHDLVLKAALIELGPESSYQKLSGMASSAVDVNNQFTMDVDPGQGLLTPLSLFVQIQDGTLLINRKGSPVKAADIDIGKLVSVRGVLDVANDTLFASLIIVDTDSSTQLSGTVGANPDGSCGFTLMTVDGDRSISTDATTRAFLVVGSSSMPILVSDLKTGQTADAYGNFSNGCFDAHTIIAY